MRMEVGRMAKLIYVMNASLDGYTEDDHGVLWRDRSHDEEVHPDLPACVVIPHLSLRTESVRSDDVLGDRAHCSQSATIRARLCEGVAGSGENRLLEDSRRPAQRTDEN